MTLNAWSGVRGVKYREYVRTKTAAVVKKGLSARCRAVFENSGPYGPEWYGKDTWDTMKLQEYHWAVAVLQARLNGLAAAEGRCLDGRDEALRQGVVFGRVRSNVKAEKDDTIACLGRVRVERAKIETTLAHPELVHVEATKLRLEIETLSEALRQQLHVLLESVRDASEIFGSGGSYDAFSLRLTAIRQQSQSMRVTYTLPLQMGEHETLDATVLEACAALDTVDLDWKKEREAAKNLATAQARTKSYRRANLTLLDRANAEESEPRLRAAEQEYDQAKTQLAAKRDPIARLVSEAVRVAKDDQAQAQQVNLGTRNP